MIDILYAWAALVALLGYGLVPLWDVLSYTAPAAPVTKHGGSMTAQGVPYVPGGPP